MKNYTLTLTESEIRDIRMALIKARFACNNDSGRFMALREKILDQQKDRRSRRKRKNPRRLAGRHNPEKGWTSWQV